MKTCPYCAEKIQDVAVICRYCGKEISTQTPAENQILNNRQKWIILLIALMVCVILVGAGGGGYFALYGPQGIFPKQTSTSVSNTRVAATLIAKKTAVVIAATQERKAALTATQENYCGVQAGLAASKKFEEIYSRWTDATNLAGQTSRVALKPVITNLQKIKREAEAVKIPDCMIPMKKALISSMDEAIEGFIAFKGQSSDSVVASHFNASNEQTKIYIQEIERLLACLPNCR